MDPATPVWGDLFAHGIGGQTDLPLPLPLTIAGAVAALTVSLTVLAVAWRTPRYDAERTGRPAPRRLAALAPQRARRPLEELSEGLVEAPHAAKAGGQCDRRHGQLRVVDELLGEQHAPCLRDRVGRCTQVLREQPTQLAPAHAQALG